MPRKFSLFDPSVAVVATADYLPISDESSKPRKAISVSLRRNPSLLLIIFTTLSIVFGVSGVIFALYAVLGPIPTFRCGRVEDTFRPFYSQRLGGDDGLLRDRIKFVGFVGVQTGFGSRDRREALRSTWFPSHPDALLRLGSLPATACASYKSVTAPSLNVYQGNKFCAFLSYDDNATMTVNMNLRLEQATGLAFRFVIGRTKDAYKMAELEKEIEEYNDFLILDVEEEYLKLNYKTLAYFKAAFQLFEADYYVKADDDIYLRPDRLATLLDKERTHALTYIGCMKKGPVFTNPKLKWYEKSANVIGSEYFLHAYGPIYVLSAGVVASLAVARNNSLRMFNNEDVTIGSWMLAMNVQHEDNRAICDPRCTSTSIAVWDIPKCSGLCNPATRMKQLHNISMCSKSPTLPSDGR